MLKISGEGFYHSRRKKGGSQVKFGKFCFTAHIMEEEVVVNKIHFLGIISHLLS